MYSTALVYILSFSCNKVPVCGNKILVRGFLISSHLSLYLSLSQLSSYASLESRSLLPSLSLSSHSPHLFFSLFLFSFVFAFTPLWPPLPPSAFPAPYERAQGQAVTSCVMPCQRCQGVFMNFAISRRSLAFPRSFFISRFFHYSRLPSFFSFLYILFTSLAFPPSVFISRFHVHFWYLYTTSLFQFLIYLIFSFF